MALIPRGKRAIAVFILLAAVLTPCAVSLRAGAAEAGDRAKMELGRQVFTKVAQPPCGLCHTLEDAGTKGEIGVKLEEIQPDESRVLQAVRQGSGVMPRYDDKLTKEQMEAVAYYVARAVKPR